MRHLFLLLSLSSAFAADAPTLHPKASALPHTHQGPFVTTADGGVLCIDNKNALRSTDEGRTWTSTPLFADPTKFSISNERALLRTREGVIISAWMNGVEKKTPKGWHWGEASVQWTEFILPTYTCRSTDDGKTWEAPVKLSEHQRKLLRELDESLKKGGAKHSPTGDSWTDRLKSFFS